MIIISHRGYWKSEDEKNTRIAFERSFSSGFGTETDIRDYKGELVISHSIPDDKAMPLEDFFKLYKKYLPDLTLALNIKADGLQPKLKTLIEKHKIKNYFVFDMSLPEALKYIQSKLNSFTRQSEYEPEPYLYQESQGVWIDSFTKDWNDFETIKNHLKAGKKTAFVSPEIHRRNHLDFWKKLSKIKEIKSNSLILCTDLPEEAKKFFKEVL